MENELSLKGFEVPKGNKAHSAPLISSQFWIRCTFSEDFLNCTFCACGRRIPVSSYPYESSEHLNFGYGFVMTVSGTEILWIECFHFHIKNVNL
jgi:hypothetical protein